MTSGFDCHGTRFPRNDNATAVLPLPAAAGGITGEAGTTVCELSAGT